MFGLSGSHRSGKSTTAKLVAEKMGIRFHETSTTRVMQEGGFQAVANLPLDERIKAQEYVLARHLDDLANLPRPCIVDRTPLDMIGYMLGEVTMNNSTQEQGERIHRYVQHALKTADLYYDSILILRPLPVYEVDPTKPPPNPAYQWEHQFLVEGAGKLLRHVTMGHIATTDLDKRVSAIANFFTKRLEEMKSEVAEYPNH